MLKSKLFLAASLSTLSLAVGASGEVGGQAAKLAGAVARDQVRAEPPLLLAQATAAIGEVGIVFSEPRSARSRTRDEVRAELAATASHRVAAVGEVGIVISDPPSTRSRAEVVAELREAIRLGLLGGGEAGPPRATPAQEEQIVAAGKAAARSVEATLR